MVTIRYGTNECDCDCGSGSGSGGDDTPPFASDGDCFSIYSPTLPCGSLPCHLCVAWPLTGSTSAFMSGRTAQADCCQPIGVYTPRRWGLDFSACICGWFGPEEFPDWNAALYPFEVLYAFEIRGLAAGSYTTFNGTNYTLPADGFRLKITAQGVNEETIYFIAFTDVPCDTGAWVFDLLVDEFAAVTLDPWPATLSFSPCVSDGQGIS